MYVNDVLLMDIYKECSLSKGSITMGELIKSQDFIDYYELPFNWAEWLRIKNKKNDNRSIKERWEAWLIGKACEYLLISRTNNILPDERSFLDVLFKDKDGNLHSLEVKSCTFSQYSLDSVKNNIIRNMHNFEEASTQFIVLFRRKYNNVFEKNIINFETVDYLRNYI